MATATLTKPAAKGGSFLLESPQPGDVFTPADLTDDQKLIGQTAEEFVLKEVFPIIKDLENKKPGLMPQLVKKGGEVGLMGGGVPEEFGGAGLDKISTTVLTEKLSIYGGFAVTHGAHAGIGTLPIVYFGTEAQKKKYLPKLATGEWIGAYCLYEPQDGSGAHYSRPRAHRGVQHSECGAIHAGRFLRGRLEARADGLLEICERAQSVWKTDWRFRIDEGKAGGDGHPDFRGGIDGVPFGGKHRSGDGRGFRLRRQNPKHDESSRGIRHRECHCQGLRERNAVFRR